VGSASILELHCDHAYVLGEDFRRGAVRATPREPLAEDFALARGEYRPREKILFVQTGGRTLHDLIGTGYPSIKLWSSRTVDTLRQSRFSGWETFDVEIHLANGTIIRDYHGLAVTGRSGPIDDSLSQSAVVPPLTPGGQSMPGLRGLCFDPTSWDGRDVFTPEGYAGIFVVRAVVDAIVGKGISNVSIRRASEIERMWRA